MRLTPVIVTALAASACSKNSQEPDGEPLVRRPLPGEVSAGGATESGPKAPTAMPRMPTTPPATAAGSGGDAGRADYAARCSGCHGASGAGDGPMSAAFPVRPRSFVDAAWQASVTDAQIADIIVRGSAALGKSPAMPPAPDLGADPARLKALVDLVRGFGPAGRAP